MTPYTQGRCECRLPIEHSADRSIPEAFRIDASTRRAIKRVARHGRAPAGRGLGVATARARVASESKSRYGTGSALCVFVLHGVA